MTMRAPAETPANLRILRVVLALGVPALAVGLLLGALLMLERFGRSQQALAAAPSRALLLAPPPPPEQEPPEPPKPVEPPPPPPPEQILPLSAPPPPPLRPPPPPVAMDISPPSPRMPTMQVRAVVQLAAAPQQESAEAPLEPQPVPVEPQPEVDPQPQPQPQPEPQPEGPIQIDGLGSWVDGHRPQDLPPFEMRRGMRGGSVPLRLRVDATGVVVAVEALGGDPRLRRLVVRHLERYRQRLQLVMDRPGGGRLPAGTEFVFTLDVEAPR